MVNIISDYVPPFASLPNIAPFTYKDGETYLSTLENLRIYVNTTLVNFVNSNYALLGDSTTTEINALIGSVNAALAAQVVTFNNQLTTLSNTTVTITDSTIVTLLNNIASNSRVALDGLYVSKTLTAIGQYLNQTQLNATYSAKADYNAVMAGSGIDKTGVSDSTIAMQAIINANPGKTIIIPVGIFLFSQLLLNKGQTLIGSGQQDWRDRYTNFGDVGWANNANFNGTILRSIATSGNAITLVDTEVNSGGVANLTLIGPGNGTSTGLQIGSVTMSVVNAVVNKVKIGNFYVGLSTTMLNEASFNNVMLRGCTTGFNLGHYTIQNAFYMLDIERCFNGMIIDAGAWSNSFYSMIGQSNTGTAVTANGIKNIFYNPYFENNTIMAVDVLGTSQGLTFINMQSQDSTDISKVESGATDTSFINYVPSAANPGLTNVGTRTYLQGRFTNLNDIGTQTILIDSGAPGSAFGIWKPYVPILSGTGWAIGNATVSGTYTIIGNTVHFRGTYGFGSTSTYGAGAPVISTPTNIYDRGTVQCFYTSTGNNLFFTVPKLINSGNGFSINILGTNGVVPLTSTSPATIKTGDTFEFAGTYERITV
jgi:hypothetical protein